MTAERPPPADLTIVRVGLPVPVARVFDYVSAPAEAPHVGARVRVPFGRRKLVGVVLGHASTSDLEPAQLKYVLETLDSEPLLDEALLELIVWAASYYHHPIGEALAQALPGSLRAGGAIVGAPAIGWRLTPAGSRQDLAVLRRRAPRQAAALARLDAETPCPTPALAAAGIGADVLRRLASKDWIARTALAAQSPQRAPQALSPAGPDLTTEQRNAVNAVLEDEPGFAAYLLHGVTGSGKTEVYLRLISRALHTGHQSLLLVPEIGLTPQLVSRLQARFGTELAVLHSGLRQSQRVSAWRRARSGEAKLVVGTRSAIFASLPRLGLIVIDEEHDTSYKQQTGFRYSARDLGIVRAQKLGIKVVLGSATPSLESYHNARTGRYRHLELKTRVGQAGVPRIRVVDLNKHASRQSLSTPLLRLIDEHLGKGNQVILFLNRRGFAPVLFCPTCAATEQCDRCDASLTVHARAGRLRCHHCGRDRPLRWSCPICGTERLGVGAGTQRVDEELQALHPESPIARLDRDATVKRGSLEALLADAASGRTRVLIGTQMLAKGHDFPMVTLVGVLNADQGLFGTDFRSAERLAQTIVQVAGRAGRGAHPGEVVIQTHYPDHPLLKCLIERGYSAFADLALREREVTGWPPFSYVATFRAEAAREPDCFDFLDRVRQLADEVARDVIVLGPAPSTMARQSGRYRAQVVLKSARRGPLHAALSAIETRLRLAPRTRRVRWSLDVDPVEF